MSLTIPWHSERPVTTTQLNRLLTEIPQKIAATERKKALLYNIASKICLVAFTAIVASVLATSLGLIFPIHPLLLCISVLSTVPLQMGFQGCMTLSISSEKRAKEAEMKAALLSQIQQWDRSQIESFFKEHKLSLDSLPWHLLNSINPDEPLRTLLPAIASYLHLRNQTQMLYQEHERNLHNEYKDPALRLIARRLGWKLLEYQVFPKALEAASVIQVIAHPHFQKKLEDIGTCYAKEFDQRRFDQLLGNGDEYFVFKQERHPSLSFSEMQQLVAKMDFDALRLKIFSE